MFLCRCARNGPELLEPFIELLLWNHAEAALIFGGLTVAAGLALHEDEFNIVLDNRIGLVRLPEEFRAVAHFIARVGYLVPDNWIEVVKA